MSKLCTLFLLSFRPRSRRARAQGRKQASPPSFLPPAYNLTRHPVCNARQTCRYTRTISSFNISIDVILLNALTPFFPTRNIIFQKEPLIRNGQPPTLTLL